MVRAAIYVVWGSAKVQPWNNPTRNVAPECGIKNDYVKNGEKKREH